MKKINEDKLKKEFEIAISRTNSMRAASKLMNIPYKTFIVYAKKFGIYKPNQGLKGIPNENKNNKLEQILNNEIKCKSVILKKMLIIRGKIEYKCYSEDCNITDKWLNNPIILELDHIDGNRNNNNLKNLRLLCPNCHSQTPTFRGRKYKKYSDEEIILAFNKSLNINQLFNTLGMAAKGGNYESIRKRLKMLNLSFDNEFNKIRNIYYCNCGSGIEVKTQKTKCDNCIKRKRHSKKYNSTEDKTCECGIIINYRSEQCEKCSKFNQRKVERPSYNTLKQELNESNYSALGRKYGVSDNTIRNWLKMYEKHGENY